MSLASMDDATAYDGIVASPTARPTGLYVRVSSTQVPAAGSVLSVQRGRAFEAWPYVLVPVASGPCSGTHVQLRQTFQNGRGVVARLQRCLLRSPPLVWAESQQYQYRAAFQLQLREVVSVNSGKRWPENTRADGGRQPSPRAAPTARSGTGRCCGAAGAPGKRRGNVWHRTVGRGFMPPRGAAGAAARQSGGGKHPRRLCRQGSGMGGSGWAWAGACATAAVVGAWVCGLSAGLRRGASRRACSSERPLEWVHARVFRTLGPSSSCCKDGGGVWGHPLGPTCPVPAYLYTWGLPHRSCVDLSAGAAAC